MRLENKDVKQEGNQKVITKDVGRLEDFNHEELVRFLVDMLHRIVVHHTLWFREVEHQFGMPKALEIMNAAFKRSYEIQMQRLGKTLGFEMVNDLPKPLLDLPREVLIKLMDSLAVNWLVNDGVWFQAVENAYGMFDAKRCNDTCWARFSPFEAWSIKQFFNMPEMPGLEGLKKALQFRIYARINKQSIIEEGPNSFVFQMNDCRVQAARKRKGLEDYPCKSAGLVEYRSFAETIDPRIRTECVGCPPDPHPEEWWCAWRFTI
ncbi:DUF6125 family protein [Calderihabitans maritimus]|uniref:Cytosolic protein n=1 Tax=Calderihabitans maritimus TaxID=1246530 RepID=A0A1Z5HQL6_9FIRM|nr:DUF6125 family protein [Calderihabitans maritimus]GAW91804.1 hypothetical protein Slip_0289 [Calderihabitans maritimus]